MIRNGDFFQASNAQAAVPVDQIIVAHGHWDMRERVISPRGKRIYALRKILVEPVFRQIKAAMGF